MRRADELRVWRDLQAAHANATPNLFSIGPASVIDLSRPCTVLGGRNGSGKSRLLRSIAASLGEAALYLDLHHLCEQALMVLRSLNNLAEMKDELGLIGPDDKRLDDVRRVVGRDYESVEWYALDVGPEGQEIAAKFRWGRDPDDDPLTPYFTVSYAGITYDALEMGLGEFSVHFLLWILEQFKDHKDLTLLLDEPDAYLPPVGVEGLLSRLLAICQKRGWRMLISTHSEEMIASAVDHDGFLLLRMGESGSTDAYHSEDDPTIADTLLARPPIERVLFVEDESAWYLCRALLDQGDRSLSKSTSLVWGGGNGFMTPLRTSLPRPPKAELAFAVVPDGDQRGKMSDRPIDGQWPLHFLPDTGDPDELFRTLKDDPVALAEALHVDSAELQRKLDELEGEDAHDWVNRLGDVYGRPHVLTVLAACWAQAHPDESVRFALMVRAGD
ncbi:hypothetical protein [Microbacterium sp. AG157]|uniref:hypothetical protein n=1 Tax=Microbacterium sp. AG157 TaxID=2183993 RepID=UPI0011C0234D|nr:hypothetical protein [Microbacterium sp. AG157]